MTEPTKVLDGRVAIVTGAAGGLGRAHALYLASQGAAVVINDMGQHAADRVAEEVRWQGGRAFAVAASVTDEVAVGAMVTRALTEFGRIDVVVNNAGVLRDKSFAKMDLADFRLVVDVHLMGATIVCKAVWDTMRSQNYGRIVMTTSSSGLYGNFGQANYGAAKMALVGLMQTLAIEGAKNDIRVNCLAPTAATGMTEGVMSEENLRRLNPTLVSPGLLPLVGEDAPTRAILCAGAGHFAAAHVTLTDGVQLGAAPDAGQQLAARWADVVDRSGEIVPTHAFVQSERELAAASVVQGDR